MHEIKDKIFDCFIFIAIVLAMLIPQANFSSADSNGNEKINETAFDMEDSSESLFYSENVFVYQSGGVCPHPDRKPRKSKTKGKHMDEDCCPDPDEWPKSGCAYSAHDLSIMMNGPK